MDASRPKQEPLLIFEFWTFKLSLRRASLNAIFHAVKGRDQWEWIGLWKVAIYRHLIRIVVIDVHFYFNLAAILE